MRFRRDDPGSRANEGSAGLKPTVAHSLEERPRSKVEGKGGEAALPLIEARRVPGYSWSPSRLKSGAGLLVSTSVTAV